MKILQYCLIGSLALGATSIPSFASDFGNTENNYSPQAIASQNKTFEVVDITHPEGADGKYFNFQNKQVDRLLGRTNWNSTKLLVRNLRTQKVNVVVLWRKPNRGGNLNYRYGHGRWNDGTAKSGQWKIGDEIKIQVPRGYAKVLDVNHPQGANGKYFNFQNEEIDRIVGGTNWDGKQFWVRDSRTGKTSVAILWRRPYGGSNLDYR